jgi:hypothetical protein
MNDWSDEETLDPLKADDRDFYKVEKWTKDGAKLDSLLYAGNNLGRAQEMTSRKSHCESTSQLEYWHSLRSLQPSQSPKGIDRNERPYDLK